MQFTFNFNTLSSIEVNDHSKYCRISVYQFRRQKSIGKRSYNLLLTSIPCQVLKLMITLNIAVYQFISSVDKNQLEKDHTIY